MKNIMKPKHVLTINKEGFKEFISTGATFNQIEYISLPTILGMYQTTDPTLRKYLNKKGQRDVDYFYADGKLFISSLFLLKNNFFRKKDNTSTFHPYRKKRLTGCIIPYSLVNEDEQNCSTYRGKMIKELKKINWDYFITINTIKFVSSDDWDYIMDKFINLLSRHLDSKLVCSAYSKEKSIKNNKTNKKYDQEHHHIHLLLHKDSKFIKLETIKSLFLQSMNKRRFNKNEYQLMMYDKNDNGIEYILKDFNVNESNFSMIYSGG
jgi:hypothetical protein